MTLLFFVLDAAHLIPVFFWEGRTTWLWKLCIA